MLSSGIFFIENGNFCEWFVEGEKKSSKQWSWMLDKRKCEKDQASSAHKERKSGRKATAAAMVAQKLTLSSKSPSEIFTAFHNVEKFIGLRIIIFQSTLVLLTAVMVKSRPTLLSSSSPSFARPFFFFSAVIVFDTFYSLVGFVSAVHTRTHNHQMWVCVCVCLDVNFDRMWFKAWLPTQNWAKLLFNNNEFTTSINKFEQRSRTCTNT